MRKFKFFASFPDADYGSGKLSKQYFSLLPERNSKAALGQYIQKYKTEAAAEYKNMAFTVVLIPPKKDYTEKQRNTLWFLINLTAEVMNAGKPPKDRISADRLYRDYIYIYGKSSTAFLPYDIASYLAEEYSINDFQKMPDGNIQLTVWRSFSHMDVYEAAEMIDFFLNTLADMGLDINLSAQAEQKRREYRQRLNDDKMVLYDDCSIAKYRELNKSCEACGKFIYLSGGSFAHIMARGMGGNQKPWQDTPFNGLMLCDPCHAEFDNGKGRSAFEKKYPWLKYKIGRAYEKTEQEAICESKE